MPTLKLLILFTILTSVSSDGVFELKINEFVNELGKTKDGKCCATQRGNTKSNCSEQCRTFFRVCATHTSLSGISTTESPAEAINSTLGLEDPEEEMTKNARFNIDFPCTIGMTVTKVVAENSYLLLQDAPLQFYYKFPFPWPGDVSIIIEAWHRKVGKNDPIKGTYFDRNEIGRMIERFAINKVVSPKQHGNEWHMENIKRTNMSLNYEFRVKCGRRYYGANCSNYCSASETPGRFICNNDGKKICREGWTGVNCETPMCLQGCHEVHGKCRKPGECHCTFGWTGDRCDKCMLLPGCHHGTCDSPFECNCKEGWDGMFCNYPMCKDGCHGARGYCKVPNECRCRIGWGGHLCQNCTTLPYCVHGYCNKPLDCICETGWTGTFCDEPMCRDGCDEKKGTCEIPGVCRCRVGWKGENCTTCLEYPGCQHGFCNQPYECQCQQGWGGYLCDQKLDYCNKNNPCMNGAECVSKSKEDGNYLCICLGKYTGKNCDVLENEISS